MKQRLLIGLMNPSPGLLSMLGVIGCACEVVTISDLQPTNYAVVITENPINKDKQSQFSSYLTQGGCLLELGEPVFYRGGKSIKQYADYLLNSGETDTNQIPFSFLDLYHSFYAFDDDKRIDSALRFTRHGSGYLCSLGIELGSLWQRNTYRRKRFQTDTLAYPDEIVAETDRNALIELLTWTLKKLFFAKKLPWITKWHFPDERPVFCLRIDSDYGTKERMDQLFELSTQYQIPFTWFLHVAAHEDWLGHFSSYANQGQEIALHGYRHVTGANEDKLRTNIRLGYNLLQKAGYQADGFCAPYGIMNTALQSALSTFDFTYTSEFTLGYDCYPFKMKDLPLQIPVHPVCTGSMSRKGFEDADMEKYFLQVAEHKLANGEPLIFYHHPMQKGLSAIRALLDFAKNHNLNVLTFRDYAGFSKERMESSFQPVLQDGSVRLNAESTKLYYQLSSSFDSFDLIQHDISLDALSHSFKNPTASILSGKEISSLKKTDLKLMKTSILDWINREKA